MAYVILRTYIDNFSDGIEAVSAAYKGRLSAALASIDLSAPDAERQVTAVMQSFCKGSTSTAAYLAKRFYLGLRALELGDLGDFGGVEDSGYVPEATRTAVRGIIADSGPASDGGALMASQLRGRLGYEVKRASGATMLANGEADPRRPRFARIPQPSRSYARGCPFCQMLASRGFAYLSAASAGELNHYHDDCRCVIVPSWSGSPAAEGYDPRDYDAGYQKYLDQDHSKHEERAKSTRRNRYDSHGRLKAGYSGLRVDQQRLMTDADREAQHRKNVAAQHAGWKAAYEKRKQGGQNG
jgi:hypothetical protein